MLHLHRSRCHVRQDLAVLRKSVRHKDTMTAMKISDFIPIKSNFKHPNLYSFQNLSFWFILKIFLKFRKFLELSRATPNNFKSFVVSITSSAY